MQHQQPGLVDGNASVSDALPVSAQVHQRFSERGAVQSPSARMLEGHLGQADQAHRMMHTARPQPPLGDLESLARSRDEGIDGQPYVLERHHAVSARLVVEPHRRQHPFHSDARSIHRDENHRVARVSMRVRVGQPHKNDHLAVGMTDAGAPPLAAVDHHLVAVDDGRGRHVRGIRGSHVGLRHTKRGPDIALQERFEPDLLLLLAAVPVQHLHISRIRCVAIEHGGGEQRPSHLLGQRRVLGIGQAAA